MCAGAHASLVVAQFAGGSQRPCCSIETPASSAKISMRTLWIHTAAPSSCARICGSGAAPSDPLAAVLPLPYERVGDSERKGGRREAQELRRTRGPRVE